MLNARITRNIAVFLTAFLAGTLILTTVASAHHRRESGTRGSLPFSIATGDFHWDDCQSESWHYQHFYNTSTEWSVTVDWTWTHEVKRDGGSTPRSTSRNGSVTLPPAPDDVEEADPNDPDPPQYPSDFREGWLQTDISGLGEGIYHIESSVEISVTGNNGGLGSASVEHSSEGHEVE